MREQANGELAEASRAPTGFMLEQYQQIVQERKRGPEPQGRIDVICIRQRAALRARLRP